MGKSRGTQSSDSGFPGPGGNLYLDRAGHPWPVLEDVCCLLNIGFSVFSPRTLSPSLGSRLSHRGDTFVIIPHASVSLLDFRLWTARMAALLVSHPSSLVPGLDSPPRRALPAVSEEACPQVLRGAGPSAGGERPSFLSTQCGFLSLLALSWKRLCKKFPLYLGDKKHTCSD